MGHNMVTSASACQRGTLRAPTVKGANAASTPSRRSSATASSRARRSRTATEPPPRLALVPGNKLSDPAYSRILPELARELTALGRKTRVFRPESEGPALMTRFRPDAVSLHFSGRLSRNARALTRRAIADGSRLVTTFQDLDHPDLPPPTRRDRAEVARLLDASTACTALTPELAARIRRIWPRARPAVIGNAVGGEWFSPERRRDGPIVAAARLAPYKGIDLLLWAFADHARRRGDARLSLYGRDYSRGRHQRLARLLRLGGRVRFLGEAPPETLRRALSRARLFVAPSRSDSYGMAVLEAMAAGAPVLATRVGSAALLAKHGLSAWLVPPGDPRALARALERLAGDAALRRRLSRGGRALARAHGWGERARRYDELLRLARDER
jgi:glycosyltransferase involved in cell wall biosynthesis